MSLTFRRAVLACFVVAGTVVTAVPHDGGTASLAAAADPPVATSTAPDATIGDLVRGQTATGPVAATEDPATPAATSDPEATPSAAPTDSPAETPSPTEPPTTAPVDPPTSSPPSEPTCPEVADAAPLPAAAASIDLTGDGPGANAALSADGRLWFSTTVAPAHVVGIDTATGARVDIASQEFSSVAGAGGGGVYTIGVRDGAVRYDLATGARTWAVTDLRYGPSNTTYPVGMAADADGAWVLFVGGSADDPIDLVVRYAADGTTQWTTRLPDVPHGVRGFSTGPGYSVAAYGGDVYVVEPSTAEHSTATAWRVSADGAVAASRDLGVTAGSANPIVAANAAGVYATVSVPGGGLDSVLMRLDPVDLHVTATAYADTVESMSASETGVYVVGITCRFMLSRFDPVTLERTGFWEFGGRAYTVVAHDGAPWLLHTAGYQFEADSLRRYDL